MGGCEGNRRRLTGKCAKAVAGGVVARFSENDPDVNAKASSRAVPFNAKPIRFLATRLLCPPDPRARTYAINRSNRHVHVICWLTLPVLLREPYRPPTPY